MECAAGDSGRLIGSKGRQQSRVRSCAVGKESELGKQELYRALTGGRYKERGSIAVPQTTQLTKIRSPVTDWALLIFSNKPTGQPNFNILVKFLNRSSRKRLAQARNMKDISNRPSPFERKTFDQRAR